jgi:hypothetical protein
MSQPPSYDALYQEFVLKPEGVREIGPNIYLVREGRKAIIWGETKRMVLGPHECNLRSIANLVSNW